MKGQAEGLTKKGGLVIVTTLDLENNQGLIEKLIEVGGGHYTGFNSFEDELGITSSQLPNRLALIAYKCKDFGLPVISVKVKTGTGEIGTNLFEWLKNNYPEYSQSSKQEVYEKESEKISQIPKGGWRELHKAFH
jgi:hypothetical protein